MVRTMHGDLGTEVATDRHRTITFFTRAVGHFVESVLDAGLHAISCRISVAIA
jgi:hypothetical protein